MVRRLSRVAPIEFQLFDASAVDAHFVARRTPLCGGRSIRGDTGASRQRR
jgi:hypothetical protein